MLGLELLTAGHLLWHASASAPAAGCPVQKSARVDVRLHYDPIKFDFGRTTDTLNHSQIDTVNPYGTHVSTDVGGLMSGKIQYESNIQISTMRYPADNVSCLWVDKVAVDVTISPNISIAAEHPEGTCEHGAILEHEYKHVAADRAVVKDHLQSIRQSAVDSVQKVGMVGPKGDDTVDDFKKKMTDYIQAAVKSEMDKLYDDRKVRQAAIDTRQEYDRVDEECKTTEDSNSSDTSGAGTNP